MLGLKLLERTIHQLIKVRSILEVVKNLIVWWISRLVIKIDQRFVNSKLVNLVIIVVDSIIKYANESLREKTLFKSTLSICLE